MDCFVSRNRWRMPTENTCVQSKVYEGKASLFGSEANPFSPPSEEDMTLLSFGVYVNEVINNGLNWNQTVMFSSCRVS